jgi:hypothetical protein
MPHTLPVMTPVISAVSLSEHTLSVHTVRGLAWPFGETTTRIHLERRRRVQRVDHRLGDAVGQRVNGVQIHRVLHVHADVHTHPH